VSAERAGEQALGGEYALIPWDEHKRNGYCPAFWITAGILAAVTILSVLESAFSRGRPLTRISRIRNPFLRNTLGLLRALEVLALRFLTPGLSLVGLFAIFRARTEG
jgi:hypothetical protein